MRRSGVLLPISCLPAPFGKGGLGRDAYRFVDFLATAGQGLWQVNTLPTAQKRGTCVFAGRVDWIDLDLLCEEGLLKKEEQTHLYETSSTFLRKAHTAALIKAAGRQSKTAPDYLRFKEENEAWLDDYALFMSLREAQGGKPLHEWPEALRRRNSYALKTASTRLATRMDFWRCVQFFYHRQWRALKKYANAKGIQLAGELPFFVSADSADVWVYPELFQAGQAKIGATTYDWPQHKRSRFAWWLARLSHAANQMDTIRMPHFQGFAGEWVPEAKEDAKSELIWKAGPGTDFVRALHRALPNINLLTEDGTTLCEDASALLAYSGFAGTKVLQHAFSAQGDKSALPHRHAQHVVLYTSESAKHSLEHWQNTADPAELALARRYFGIHDNTILHNAFLHAAQASVAKTVVIPLWDWLPLCGGSSLPKNSTSFTVTQADLSHWLAAEMRELATLYERKAPQEPLIKNKVRKTKITFFQKGAGKEHE